MDNNKRSNPNNKKSKIEIKKDSNNPPKEFKSENQNEISPSKIEFEPNDKNEIIPLLNESKKEDINERIHKSIKNKSKDKNEIIPLSGECKDDNKNENISILIKSEPKDKNEIIPLSNESKEEKQKGENDILSNQFNSNNNINITLSQSNSKANNKNTFPKGTIYEEELNQYFQYFNVFWYDPSGTSDYELFEKCFEKVEFYRGYDLLSSINFFQKESISEYIVITPGFSGEELIMNLENFKCIKYFFIYCKNAELHENWIKKYKKIICLTSDPEILCLKFLEVNDYFIPNFNYKCKENIDFSKPSENYNSLKMKTIGKNKYNKLCIKILKYLDGDNIINDMKGTSPEKKSIFN